MSAPAGDAAEGARQVERWVYGGLRLGKSNKRLGAWVDPSEQEDAQQLRVLYFAYSSAHVVGSVYEVEVTRHEKQVTRHGEPRYVGKCEDSDLRAELFAKDRAERAELEQVKLMRQHKADDPFLVAIDQLAAIIQRAPSPQRTHLINYAAQRLARKAWG